MSSQQKSTIVAHNKQQKTVARRQETNVVHGKRLLAKTHLWDWPTQPSWHPTLGGWGEESPRNCSPSWSSPCPALHTQHLLLHLAHLHKMRGEHGTGKTTTRLESKALTRLTGQACSCGAPLRGCCGAQCQLRRFHASHELAVGGVHALAIILTAGCIPVDGNIHICHCHNVLGTHGGSGGCLA